MVLLINIMRSSAKVFLFFSLGCLGISQGLPSAKQIAIELLAHPNIVLAESHVSEVTDLATARDNIQQTADGKPAQRSAYDNAPGGTVALEQRMLWGLRMIADRFKLRVSEIAGGSHSPNSRHYAGLAFDLNQINGVDVSETNNSVAGVQKICRALGATEALGPGDAGHGGHVHCAWSRR